jgi:predicted nuclease with TOPRIM domain
MNSREKTRTRIPLPDGRVLDIDENNDVFSACLMLDGEKFIPAFHYYIKCSELEEQVARLDRIILEKGEFALRNRRLFNEVVSLGKRIKSLEEEKANSEDLYKKLGEVMMKTLWEFRSKTEW